MQKSLLARAFVIALVVLLPVTLFAEGGRTPLRVENGIVTSASRLASEVGVDILQQGGNAVDAAVATAFALAVTWPTAGNIGGGGFMVYHGADGHATTFDFREKAPLASTERMYVGADGQSTNMQHRGFLSVGVPGTVAGLVLAHEKQGNLPWAALVEPAIRLARDGIPVTYALYDGFNRNQANWDLYPSSAAVFRKADGSHYQLGDTWVQPDLARTLERIRDEGHDGFYRGENARMLASFMQANGGLITEEDLARYEAIEREPVRGSYRGYDVISMPPPSSGGVGIIQMLNILEGFDLAEMGHNSAQYLHVLTEAMRRSYASRAEFLGDPDFNPDMPVDRLISKDYADSLRASIDMDRASISDESRFSQVYVSEDTTHFSVVDAEGNMVSLTYTLEQSYGSRIVAEGGGYLLNNEMGDFNPVPGVTTRDGQIGTPPNLLAPEKRMLSSMSPTIVAQGGRPVLAIGSPGGRTIINTTLQVILNMIDHDMNVAQAVEAGRIHHQWLPDVTSMEELMFSPDTIRLYEAKGHTVRVRGSQGSAMGVYHDWETGIVHGSADSRQGDSAAVGY
ncbi:gamma-glutamyltransferase [Pseudohongiella sp. O18]|uniref:gamma-glutamyltransferase n=1 Tax=Pseudohongiella sp. O18 TaxID=2904248 RepID=UPI001F00A2B6|nr:gamma-glutamyltransferase [Pseudohongiella sp. O18]